MSAVRDRLNEIEQCQNGGTTISIQNDREIENKEIKRTIETAEIIRQWIEAIKENTASAEELLRNDAFHASKELERKFENSTSIAYKITNKLKELETEVKKISTETSAVSRIKKTQYMCLKKQFQEILQESNVILEQHRSKRKLLLQKSLQTVGRNVDEEELENLLEENNMMQAFTDDYLAETKEAKLQLADVEERHQELIQIERYLLEIRDLFVKMAILVECQQESLNRVEYHAGAATEYIEQGAVDIGKSASSKDRHRKRKIYIIIALIIVACFIITCNLV